MTIIEIAKALECPLTIDWDTEGNCYTAKLQHITVHRGIATTEAWGQGDSPNEALEALVNSLKGSRIEFILPETLTI